MAKKIYTAFSSGKKDLEEMQYIENLKQGVDIVNPDTYETVTTWKLYDKTDKDLCDYFRLKFSSYIEHNLKNIEEGKRIVNELIKLMPLGNPKKSRYYNLANIFKYGYSEKNIRHGIYHFVEWLYKTYKYCTDLFISVSSYENKKNGHRRADINHLFNTYELCIDMDYKKGVDRYKSVTEAIEELKEVLGDINDMDKILPMPNFIEFGNQIRLVYLFKGHLEKKQISLYEKISNEMIHKINNYPAFDFKAEAQTVTSFTRIPYFINTKNCSDRAWKGLYHYNDEGRIIYDMNNSSEVKIIKCSEEKMTYNEMAQLILGVYEKEDEKQAENHDVKKVHKNSKKKFKKYFEYGNFASVNEKRMALLEEFAKYLGRDIVGCRNNVTFLYYVHAKLYYGNDDIALIKTQEFNNNLAEPLADKDLKNTLCSAKKKWYKYKNDKFLRLLDLTADDCNKFGITFNYDRKISDRKYRDKNRKQKRLKQQRKRQTKAFKLFKENVSFIEIAKKLKISIRTVQRYHKLYIKKMQQFQKAREELIKQPDVTHDIPKEYNSAYITGYDTHYLNPFEIDTELLREIAVNHFKHTLPESSLDEMAQWFILTPDAGVRQMVADKFDLRFDENGYSLEDKTFSMIMPMYS